MDIAKLLEGDIITTEYARHIILEGDNEMVTIEQGDEAMVVEVSGPDVILELADGNRFVIDPEATHWVL